ncbi:ImmA/IrrE family metallo-endopeptidase [Bacillus sp. CECT 9360]|uniref:ImmA/IrrE family metallo-endopeptidase n=1 Tax=Bacillus sp. CECT 9360 TaxID=2845821 RepID=UPI001E4CF578|nr:ImmA/IrrE family metallo-endopeptidase [Bacillus sp. CECT 9360]CAH0344789.1 hypothetical protein BCI9360_01056 [Bacillus sp. CECT 9360]
MNKKKATEIPQFLGEKKRLDAKKMARQVSLEIALLGITDIFDVIEEKALLIKSPYKNSEGKARFSGFCSYIDNHFVVFINSAYSLGHQRYTAAHELYHVYFDTEKLKKNKLLKRDDNSNEELAQTFAAELLMPEDRLKSSFLEEVGSKEMDVYHTIRLHQTFKVSYRAMVTRCLELGLINEKAYLKLTEYGTIENKELLQTLTKESGYKIDLLLATNERYVSRKFVDFAIDNFSNNKISEGRLKSLLEYAGVENFESIVTKHNKEKNS